MSQHIPQEFPDPPSPSLVRDLRAGTIVVLGTCGISLLAGIVFSWPLGYLPTFMVFTLSGVVEKWLIPRGTSRRFWYNVRYAWLGDRAKPPRMLSERFVRRERERAQAEAAAEAHRASLGAVERWVQDGMPSLTAPAPGLNVPYGSDEKSVELTTRELDAIITATHGRSLLTQSSIDATEAERAAQVGHLVERGILRPAAEGFELVPEWLAVLAVARFASQAVSFSWQENEKIVWFIGLSVLGRVVRHDPPEVANDGPPSPDSKHRFALSTAHALADLAVEARAALVERQPSGHENFMAITRLDDTSRGTWTVMADDASGFVLKDTRDDDTLAQRFDAEHFHGWVRNLLHLSSTPQLAGSVSK